MLFYKPENMARKSEEFHADVVSETLAGVFYKQGHLHKSLEMYEKLMLQNPDKKDIIAARIKSIKEQIVKITATEPMTYNSIYSAL